jgi:putative ABC transport system permease protein
MESLLQDIRFAFRVLRKSPGFTAVAVLTLALGIGANTAIFSVIESVLLRPLPYVHPESLVEVRNTYPGFQPVSLCAGDYADFHREAKNFSAMGAYGEVSQGYNLTGVGEPERVQTNVATSDLFSMLGIRAIIGRTFLPEEDKVNGPAVALLSHAYWQRRFGADAAVLDREILLTGRNIALSVSCRKLFRSRGPWNCGSRSAATKALLTTTSIMDWLEWPGSSRESLWPRQAPKSKR